MASEDENEVKGDTKEAQKRGRPFVSGDPRGNPGGRSRMSEAARTMLGDAEIPAIKALVDGLRAFKTVYIRGELIQSELPDHETRRGCANDLLAWKNGKPAQAITGEEGGPLGIGVVVLPAEEK